MLKVITIFLELFGVRWSALGTIADFKSLFADLGKRFRDHSPLTKHGIHAGIMPRVPLLRAVQAMSLSGKINLQVRSVVHTSRGREVSVLQGDGLGFWIVVPFDVANGVVLATELMAIQQVVEATREGLAACLHQLVHALVVESGPVPAILQAITTLLP